jgi:hypothetical protein
MVSEEGRGKIGENGRGLVRQRQLFTGVEYKK